MGAYVRNMTYQNGEIVQLKVCKQVGERFAERDARVAAAAFSRQLEHFATMRDGKWNIWSTEHTRRVVGESIGVAWLREQHKPIMQDIPRAAAEMWLMHRGKR